MWLFLQTNWHKILVVVLAIASAWKFFFQYIRPAVHHDKPPQSVSITLPSEGCVITIKPISKEENE